MSPDQHSPAIIAAEANARALSRIGAAHPTISGITSAREALGLGDGELGHAGPPFASTQAIPRLVLNALARRRCA